MKNLQRLIGSLNHLSAFEAAARLGSFTKAARELGISQPAVSQSVRQLEGAIGVALFTRNHRTIALTDAGKMLQDDVSQGLGQISGSLRQLQRQAKSKHVTLSVSSAFGHYWLVPRLQEFRRAHPHIDLRMQQTDMDLNLAREGISLAVWRGLGQWRGYDCALLAKEKICALASPGWLARHGPVESLRALKACALITLEEPHRDRPTWKDYFAALGESYVDTGDGLRLNDYALVLQAGLAGEGVVFGWDHVTRHLVDTGLLVPVGPWCWESGLGFYLVWSTQTNLIAEALATRDWIVSVSDHHAAA
tara:strand:- start:5153 stop:6070 length:918 start_codon:yes stop_codon:yes gene_type:complete